MLRSVEAVVIRLHAEEIQAFMDRVFPQARAFGARIESVDDRRVVVRLPTHDGMLRPGGTVSGPTLMTLADTAMYYLVLSRVGPVELAVTTHMSIDFLRRPGLTDLLAEAEPLKLGSRLAVGRVTIRSEGDEEPVAHATVTYSIPPDRA